MPLQLFLNNKVFESLILFDSKIFRHKNKRYEVLYLDCDQSVSMNELLDLYQEIYAEFKNKFKTRFNHAIHIPYQSVNFYYFSSKEINWNILKTDAFKKKFYNGY